MASDKAAGPPALDVDHVGHRYGPQIALDDVSLTVMPSSFTVLLGLNGAGKSTLFSLITRLYAIRSGSIRILGHDIMREPGAALSRLGVVFQSRALDADISVQQNLKYHAALHGIGRSRAEDGAGMVLGHVGEGVTPGNPAADANQFYSVHSGGGVHFLFADGHVSFINASFDYRSYLALATRAGGEVISAEY